MVKEKWQQASQYMVELLHKVKGGKTQLKVEKESEYIGEINLDPAIYIELEKWAKQEKVSVEAIVYQALEYYQADQRKQDWKISVERREKNPILLLDGIARLEQNQRQEENKEEVESHDTRQPVNW